MKDLLYFFSFEDLNDPSLESVLISSVRSSDLKILSTLVETFLCIAT